MAVLILRKSGLMLFQALPNIFKDPYVTETELILWSMFYDKQEKERNK